MSKPICFVIMPISDHSDYDTNHFNRVYEHLIVPAIENVGFLPKRADDNKISDFIMDDILKSLYECEMVLCDLSSKNANVMYELGIRHSFNLPVALIKDEKTNRVFDIQGIRSIEYNSSLRVDDVKSKIIEISDGIKCTYDSRNELSNPIIKTLGIKPAEINNRTEITTDTQIILDSISGINKRILELENKKYTSFIDDNTNSSYNIDDNNKYKIGTTLYHSVFGKGIITNNKNSVLTVIFDKYGVKRLDPTIAKIQLYNEKESIPEESSSNIEKS